MHKPNFLLVGAMKSGTSSLHDYLRQHPDVFMPIFKEPSYFIEGGNIQSWQEYLALFSPVKTECAVGEASVAYLYGRCVPERIKTELPEVKILIVLRNPFDMINSLYWYMVHGGGEHLVLKDALMAESQRMRDAEFQQNCIGWPANYYYSDRAMYYEQVRRYINNFGRRRVHVELFDDFKRDPKSVCQSIFRFLEVDEQFIPNVNKVTNPAGRKKSERLHRILFRDNSLKMIAKRLLPHTTRTRILRTLSELNVSHQANPSLDAESYELVKSKFYEDIDELAQLIDRDLTMWKL